MNLTKTFAVFLFIAITALTANAQERYEQMILVYNPSSRVIATSTDTGEYKEETIPKSDSEGIHDTSAALQKIKQLSEHGWELYQTSIIIPSDTRRRDFYFHLRRPLK